MKTDSAPEVPGNTPWERLDSAVRAILRVPKERLIEEETKIKGQREKKPRRGHHDARRAQRSHAADPVARHPA